MNRRLALASVGFSLLLVLPFIAPLLVPGSTKFFHHRLAFEKPLGGLLLDVGSFFLLSIVSCLILNRLPKLPRLIAAGFISGFVLWWAAFAIFDILTSLPSFTAETRNERLMVAAEMGILKLHLIVPIAFAGIAVIRPTWSNRLREKIKLGLAAFSFSGLWIVPQIAFFAFYLHPVSEFDHSNEIAMRSHEHRIIWMLFDELSFKLAFESTPASVDLPNFHNLAAKSTSFSNVRPPQYYTDRIVPGVLSGKEIEEIKSSPTGALLYHERGHDGWQRFDPNATLLGKAGEKGWNPGVVGWYNPYCRIFATVLTTCYWQPGTPGMVQFDWLGASRRISVFGNALIIPRYFMNLFSGFGGGPAIDYKDRNGQDYRNLMNESKKLIRNEKLEFIFLHLPVPHPPGFYDRRKHALCRCGDYLDNLVLADDTLSMLNREVEQSPWGKETILIVSSDHSWRVPMWSVLSFSPEEAEVSQGIYEPRPVFMIHFPEQTTSAQFTKPFSEVEEYQIISSMLDGGVKNAEDLKAFVDQLQSTPGK